MAGAVGASDEAYSDLVRVIHQRYRAARERGGARARRPENGADTEQLKRAKEPYEAKAKRAVWCGHRALKQPKEPLLTRANRRTCSSAPCSSGKSGRAGARSTPPRTHTFRAMPCSRCRPRCFVCRASRPAPTSRRTLPSVRTCGCLRGSRLVPSSRRRGGRRPRSVPQQPACSRSFRASQASRAPRPTRRRLPGRQISSSPPRPCHVPRARCSKPLVCWSGLVSARIATSIAPSARPSSPLPRPPPHFLDMDPLRDCAFSRFFFLRVNDCTDQPQGGVIHNRTVFWLTLVFEGGGQPGGEVTSFGLSTS